MVPLFGRQCIPVWSVLFALWLLPHGVFMMNTVSANLPSPAWNSAWYQLLANSINKHLCYCTGQWVGEGCWIYVWPLVTLLLLHRHRARGVCQTIWSDLGYNIMSKIFIMYVHKWLLLFKFRFTAIVSVLTLASWALLQPWSGDRLRLSPAQIKCSTPFSQCRSLIKSNRRVL